MHHLVMSTVRYEHHDAERGVDSSKTVEARIRNLTKSELRQGARSTPGVSEIMRGMIRCEDMS
jgi:hypothetical protein